MCAFADDSTGENCDTVDGPQAHTLCIFPFNFHGVVHNTCTTIDGDRAWYKLDLTLLMWLKSKVCHKCH